MELYTLDPLYRRIAVVDRFESLIWAERFSGMGDFELKIHSDLKTRSLLTEGTQLAMNESFRVMTIETVENATTEDGSQILTLTGRSLERLMDGRIARVAFSAMPTTPKWVITDAPADIARKIFHDICVTGTLSSRDVIPMIVEGNVNFPDDTIAEPTDEITVELEPMTVYEAVKKVCDLYDMGFRIVRNFDTSQLYFDVYMGSDRTSSQTELAPVIFTPNLDNLQNTKSLSSSATYKNVAHVVSPVGGMYVYADSVDPELVEGLERRAILVMADDITDTDPEVAEARMIQRGKEALAENRRFSGFDGEISQTSQYKPYRDYNLGDLVEVQNTDGATNVMQVLEQIYVSDSQGERSYPTLGINQFITPGSWLAWDYNQVWEDLGETEYWADQP